VCDGDQSWQRRRAAKSSVSRRIANAATCRHRSRQSRDEHAGTPGALHQSLVRILRAVAAVEPRLSIALFVGHLCKQSRGKVLIGEWYCRTQVAPADASVRSVADTARCRRSKLRSCAYSKLNMRHTAFPQLEHPSSPPVPALKLLAFAEFQSPSGERCCSRVAVYAKHTHHTLRRRKSMPLPARLRPRLFPRTHACEEVRTNAMAQQTVEAAPSPLSAS